MPQRLAAAHCYARESVREKTPKRLHHCCTHGREKRLRAGSRPDPVVRYPGPVGVRAANTPRRPARRRWRETRKKSYASREQCDARTHAPGPIGAVDGVRAEGIPRADTKSGTERRLYARGARGGVGLGTPLLSSSRTVVDAYGVGSQGGCGARYVHDRSRRLAPPTTFSSAAAVAARLVDCADRCRRRRRTYSSLLFLTLVGTRYSVDRQYRIRAVVRTVVPFNAFQFFPSFGCTI